MPHFAFFAAVFAGALSTGLPLLQAPVAGASTAQIWTGKGDGTSWGDARNWANNLVPQTGDSVTIAPTSLQVRPAVTGTPSGTKLQDLTLTDASLSGGAITVMGDFAWSVSQYYEAVGARLTVEGTASFSGAGEEDSRAPMSLDGDTEIAGPGLLSVQDTGMAITNSGIMTLQPGAVVRATVCCASTDELLNTGIISVPASASRTATVAFMRFDDQGSISVGPGSVLDVSGGPGDLGGGGSVSGGGTVRFDQGAAITLSPRVSVSAGSTIELTGNAEFFGPGGLKGGGTFLWTGGTIDGSLEGANSVHAMISGPAIKTFTSPGTTPAALALSGSTTLEGTGELVLSGATSFSNLGTLTMEAGSSVGGSVCCVKPEHFTNGGTLKVAAGRARATATNLAFTNSGTMNIMSGTMVIGTLSYQQTTGRTQLAGGSLSAAKQVDIAGGTLTGFGAVNGSVVNEGTVAPSTSGGVLKITGTYEQTSKGELLSVITGTKPGANFGQLNVGSHASLSGTLHVDAGSGFTPGHRLSVAVLVCQGRRGKFAGMSGGPNFSVAYSTTGAKVVYP
jgi:hypothetical protein